MTTAIKIACQVNWKTHRHLLHFWWHYSWIWEPWSFILIGQATILFMGKIVRCHCQGPQCMSYHIQTDLSKFPSKNKLLKQDYKTQSLIIPYTPILLWENPSAKGWLGRFVRDLQAINGVVMPWQHVIPISRTLPTSVPTESKFFTIIRLCSAFFSIPVDETRQYIFALTWEGKQFTGTVMPRGFTETPLFLTNPEGWYGWYKFPRGSTLLQ